MRWNQYVVIGMKFIVSIYCAMHCARYIHLVIKIILQCSQLDFGFAWRGLHMSRIVLQKKCKVDGDAVRDS